VAGVVSAVDKTSFVLSARNSACNEGKAGFYYMAVEDLGQASPGEPVDLRLGILQPRHFLRDCTPGDWQQWYSRFSSPFPPGKEYAVLVTGCNLHVKPFYWGHHLRYHNAPAVGTSQNLNVNGFELATRPMDSGASSSP
jgi:hypothetical protein